MVLSSAVTVSGAGVAPFNENVQLASGSLGGDFTATFIGALYRSELWTFDDPVADAMTWTPRVGTWTFATGYVEHTDIAQLNALLQRTTTATETDVTVEAGFTFSAWDEGASGARLGVWIDTPGTGDTGQICVFNTYGTNGLDSVLLQERVQATGSASRRDIPVLEAGDDVVISLRRRRSPDVLQCHALVNGVRYDTPEVTASFTWPEGAIAVSAGLTIARLRYVVTYVSQ